jgi:hypothetical protein
VTVRRYCVFDLAPQRDQGSLLPVSVAMPVMSVPVVVLVLHDVIHLVLA